MTSAVIVIGGGPAGQAAATTLAELGITVGVIDEQMRPGGQLVRQPPPGSGTPLWLSARAYAEARRLLARFEATSGIAWHGGRAVVGLALERDGWHVTTAGLDGVETNTAAHVLIAAGCQDLAVPLPGWTLPGVYAAGGLQTLLKGQAIVPGARVVLAGTHPLLLIVAQQLAEAGAAIEAVLFAQPASRVLRGLRAGASALGRLPDLQAAASAYAAVRSKVRFGVGLSEILGRDMVTGVETDAGTIACDTVGLGYGFVPQSALPRMAGAAMGPGGSAGGFAALASDWMASSQAGLWVAGETAGVAGAGAAAVEGRIAALGIAQALGRLDKAEATRLAVPARRAQRRHRHFAAALDAIADPTGLFPPMRDDTVVCRCEDVPMSAVRDAAAMSANGIKLTTRCGMGLCQGRNCEPTLLRLRNDPADAGFTARFPARPVPLGDLASRE